MKTTRLEAKTRKNANRSLSAMANYHDGIPMSEITEILQKHGLVVLQEDNTEYSGIFCGREGSATMGLGYEETGYLHNDLMTYVPVDNSLLVMTWYKMESGRYEIVSYLS